MRFLIGAKQDSREPMGALPRRATVDRAAYARAFRFERGGKAREAGRTRWEAKVSMKDIDDRGKISMNRGNEPSAPVTCAAPDRTNGETGRPVIRTVGRRIVRVREEGYGGGLLDALPTVVLPPRIPDGPIRTQERRHVRPRRKGGTRPDVPPAGRKVSLFARRRPSQRGVLEAGFALGCGRGHVSVPRPEGTPLDAGTVLFPQRQRSMRSPGRDRPTLPAGRFWTVRFAIPRNAWRRMAPVRDAPTLPPIGRRRADGGGST
eukprot:scaffold47_cov334-Pavlova_lutheri.AAC.59